MKKSISEYFLTKTTLAVAVVALFAAAPAYADTSWCHGGNWSSFVGLTTNLIEYPDGISSTTTPAEATNVAAAIAYDYESVGINFVRFPVNPATVSSNWPVTQACINELLANGLYVNIGCWYIDDAGNNLIPNMNTWSNMWKTVDGVYGSNNHVYYEPINEPNGYTNTSTELLDDVYAVFLGYGLTKSASYYILDVNSACSVTNIGTDSRFNNCLMCWHNYAYSGRTTIAADEAFFESHIGTYYGRTIMNEMGADTVNGEDYEVSSTNYNVTFVQAMCDECSSLPMGFAWFPAHQTADLAGAGPLKRMFNGPGQGVVNPSLILELQSGWGLSPTWHGWDTPAGGKPSGGSFTSAFAACSWGPLREDVFGVSGGNVYHTWWFNNSGWNTWEEHLCAETPDGAPAASANNGVASREDLYYIGEDGNLYHQFYNGSWQPSINGWTQIPGPSGVTLVGSPSATSWSAGRYDVYARGNNNTIYHIFSTDGTNWSAWGNQGGSVTNDVASESWGTSRLDAYALGTGNGQVWHQYWDGSWHPTGTTWAQNTTETNCLYALGACSWGTNRIDLFNNNGTTIGHAWYDNGGWSANWTQAFTPPSTPTSAPCATSWVPSRVDVFVLGTDGECHHIYYGL